MYKSINALLLDGVQYFPGQHVDVSGIDPRTVARLVEQRKLIFDALATPEPPVSSRKKAA